MVPSHPMFRYLSLPLPSSKMRGVTFTGVYALRDGRLSEADKQLAGDGINRIQSQFPLCGRPCPPSPILLTSECSRLRACLPFSGVRGWDCCAAYLRHRGAQECHSRVSQAFI